MLKPWEEDYSEVSNKKPWELDYSKIDQKPSSEKTPGRFEAAWQRGVGALGEQASGVGLGLESAFGSNETAQRQMDEIKANIAKDAQAVGPKSTQFQDIQNTYQAKGLLEAAKEVPGYIGEKALESIPSSASPLAVAAATPGPPQIKLAAGAVTAIVQAFGEMMQRQAIEKQNASELEPGYAAAAAVPSGLLDYVVERYTLGMSTPLKQSVKEAAEQEIKKSIFGEVLKHGAKSSILGAGTETVQQGLEIGQAGLSLTDDQALQEYKEAAVAGGALEGLLGGVGGGYKAYNRQPEAPTTEQPVQPEGLAPEAPTTEQPVQPKDLSPETAADYLRDLPTKFVNPSQIKAALRGTEFEGIEPKKILDAYKIQPETVTTEQPVQPEAVTTEQPVQPEVVTTEQPVQPEAVAPEAVTTEQPVQPEAVAPEVVTTEQPVQPEAVAPEAVTTEQPVQPELNLKPIPTQQGSSPIIDFGDRKIVMVDINGTNVPFYLSTGLGGKKDVESGKWYPMFGIGEKGWINKTSGSDMNTYYGSPELAAVSKQLDDQIGDIRSDNNHPVVQHMPMFQAEHDKAAIDFINSSFVNKPAGSHKQSDAGDIVRKNIEDIKQKIAQPSNAQTETNEGLEIPAFEPTATKEVKPKIPTETLVMPEEIEKVNKAKAVISDFQANPTLPKNRRAVTAVAEDFGIKGSSLKDKIKKLKEKTAQVQQAQQPEAAQIETGEPSGGAPIEPPQTVRAEPKGEPTVKQRFLDKLDYVETNLMSDDARIINQSERQARRMGLPWKDIKKMLFEMNKAQAVHDGSVAAQGVICGTLKYNPEIYMYEAVVTDDNLHAVKQRYLDIAKQYNLSTEEANALFQDLMVARRVKEIHQGSNEKLSKREAELHMTEEAADKIINEAKKYPELFAKDGPIAIWNRVRANTMKVMVDSGRYSEETANELLDATSWVPFNRVMDNKDPEQELNTVMRAGSRGLLKNRTLHKMKGSAREVANVFENMEHWQARTFAISIKNDKALKLIDNAMKYAPIGTVEKVKSGTPNAVLVYRDGAKEYYRFSDPLYYSAFNGLQPITNDTLKFAAKFGNVLRKFIVLNPLFTIAQLPQDTYAAMYTSGLKNPLMLISEVPKQFLKTLTGTTAERERLKRTGTVGALDYSSQILNREMDIALGLKEPPKGFVDKLQRKFEQFSEAGDAALRQAIYARTMKEMAGKPDAEATAIARAFDVVNFKRHGASSMSDMIRQVTPFYGAYLQVQRVALKTLAGQSISPTERGEALKTLALTTAQMMAMSFLYASMTGDDDDITAMAPADKDNHLFLFGGDKPISIPLRKDWTLLPHVMVMHGYNAIMDDGTEDPDTARDAIVNVLQNALLGVPVGATFIRPTFEVSINKNFFTGRPIVGHGLEGLETEEQYVPGQTSELGKLAGKTGLIAPVNFDHLMRGYLGYVGSMILSATDAALQSTLDLPHADKSALEMLRKNLPGATSFIGKEEPSGDMAKFYDLQADINKSVKTLNRIKNKPEEAYAYAQEKGPLVNKEFAARVNKMSSSLAKIREAERLIQETPNDQMSPEEKASSIKDLHEQRLNVVSGIQNYRDVVYRKQKQ